MHYFSNLFDKVLYMFRTSPLSIIRSISTLLEQTASRTSMTNTYFVYTVLRYSWWWTVNLYETCRVLYQINMRNSASRWLSLYEYITMHGHLNVIISLRHDRVTLLANYGPNSVLNPEGFVDTDLNEQRYSCVYSTDIPHVAKSTTRKRQISR